MSKIRIPASQERLLGEIDLRSEVTRESLARTLRMKVPTVHYAVNSLIEKRILMRRARIDFFKLGLLDVAVFFSVSESATGARRALEKSLTNDERTGWVSRLAGEYQYAVILLVRSLHDVSGFITDLKGLKGIIVGDLIIAPRTSYSQYSRKYLSSRASTPRVLHFEALDESWRPDELDHKLLSYLGHRAFESMRSIARDLDEPVSTIENRITQMKKRGVIRGFFYEINPAGLGLQAFRFLVSTCGAPLELTRRFENFCMRHPIAIFFIDAIGSWEYEIGIEVADASVALEFAGEISEFFGVYLRNLRTIQEVQDLKWSFYPFKTNPFGARSGGRSTTASRTR